MGFKVEQGEKFALLAFSGLTIGIDDQTPNPADLGFSCWASGKLPFSLDAWWREQLGKLFPNNSKTDATSCWRRSGEPLNLNALLVSVLRACSQRAAVDSAGEGAASSRQTLRGLQLRFKTIVALDNEF